MTTEETQESRKALADYVSQHRFHDPRSLTILPNVSFFWFDAPTNPEVYVLEPSVCVILQGAKRVIVGERDQVFDSSSFFVTSVDLPLIAQVLEASPSNPYISLTFKLDRVLIAQFVLDNQLPFSKPNNPENMIDVGTLTDPLADAFRRMVRLLDEPDCIQALLPLVEREIVFRLLTSECGGKIQNMVQQGSYPQQISNAIEWIKGHLSAKLRIESLANHVGMSVSTLHHHFRSLTALSPLQYQKLLRLNEARRLMLMGGLDAATASFEVGYESPSQFSREYSRLFGAPPMRDIKTLLEG